MPRTQLTAPEQATAGPAARRTPRRRNEKAIVDVDDFPFPTTWYMTNPYVDALTAEERDGFMRAMWLSRRTRTPFRMGEDDLRVWARFDRVSDDEWKKHRDALFRLFRARPDGKWEQPVFREIWETQQKRLQKNRAGAKAAGQARWAKRARDQEAARRAAGTGGRPVAEAAAGCAGDARRNAPRTAPRNASSDSKASGVPFRGSVSEYSHRALPGAADDDLDARLAAVADRIEGHPPPPGDHQAAASLALVHGVMAREVRGRSTG